MRLLRTPFALTAALVGLLVLTRVPPSQTETWHTSRVEPRAKSVVICRVEADPRNMFTKVPPPPEFAMRTFLGLPQEKLATITVNYTGFTTQAQAAFQYAVNIWQSQLTSTGPIVVDATFTSVDFGPNTLGSASASWVFRDFGGATVAGTWYAKALANKLYGADVWPSSTPEITARFNSAFTWYLGTDGNTPAGQYDFVSVVLHELCHGLGFYGSATVSSGNGSIMRSGYPDIYDRFVENGSAQAILNTSLFPNGSAALAAQLTGDSLYWNGTTARAYNGGIKPRLYAPTTWAQGSSYSHLNEATYPAGNANSLMTYAIGAAEAVHDPGPIVRGMFTDEGWTTSGICAYVLSPASASFAPAGGTGSVTVSAGTGCAWAATSNASWITTTAGSSGSGSGTVSYAVAANAGRPRSGTMTIAGQTVTVSQSSSLPTVAVAPTTLRFGAINTGGGTLGSKTGSQEVTVTQTGTGTVPWTATADQPWLVVTSGSGAGAGKFTVSVVSSATLPATGTVSGTITVTAPAAQNDPTIPVSLTLSAPSATAPPFGVVDTPAQDSTGMVGSVAVTGWALDDVGVSSVRLYRNCLAFEPAVNCQWVGGVNVVYMGDADLVPGSRPDVEAAYPTYPQASRAGWGYLVLTNVLPHIPTEQAFGGQGRISIHVFATDVEGHLQLLGRSTGDQTPTTITMANDTAAKPFGAIDTPGQGQTVSGALWNFGWVLTPDTDTAAGAGDILVPTSGGSMWVWVDGAPVSTVTYYNLCRGTVGSPVPAGLYCNDDVANIFGNPTPQATFTPRSANPTKYRNLDAGRGAMGAYLLDTTALSNGRHSIVWGVTDSAGRVDGIGSRYFIVLNAGADEAAADAPARVIGAASEVAWRPLADGAAWGRTGFDLRAPWQTVEPNSLGTRHVRIPELGRLELYLGPGVTTGYLEVNGTLRSLPAGSQLTNGHFTWAPAVGYLGAYALVFLDGIQQVPVTVTIHAASERSRVEAYIDEPRANATVGGPLTVAGWAADPTAWAGTGIGAVHVWAHRRDADAAPVFLGAAELNGWRPDVGAQLGTQFEHAGWSVTAPALPSGEYDVVAYFWSHRTQRFEDARVVRVSAR